jgi:hypothetical protein
MVSLNVAGHGKLGPKFYEPFRIGEQVNEVAYRLELPLGAKLHNVFHVVLLKKFHGDVPTASGWLPPIRHGRACLEPATVTKSRLAHGNVELLVNWKGRANADASWMVATEFQHLHPGFKLEDALLEKGGGDVMTRICYTWCRCAIKEAAEQSAPEEAA